MLRAADRRGGYYQHSVDTGAAVSSTATGHSRAIRARLRAARIEQGLSLQTVADRIAEILGRESLTAAAVSSWETFARHPPIDMMAAWARAVGMRLIVDLDSADSPRTPVLLRPETVDMARALDEAPGNYREIVRSILVNLGSM
jgi:transcriptional regulator with XRE-family HTH domain